jgi:hypothetical protein
VLMSTILNRLAERLIFPLRAKFGRVNLQSWQLTCPQTVRKKARSLKYNDIQT